MYAGKSLVTAFKSRCPEPVVPGPGGLIRDTAVEQGFTSVFLGVNPGVVLRPGGIFLATFFFPGESRGFMSQAECFAGGKA